MKSPRQLVDWLKTSVKPAGSSCTGRRRARILVESLEGRTSLSALPVAAATQSLSLVARNTAPAAIVQVQTFAASQAGATTPDDSGMVGPQDPGGVEL